VSHKVLHDCAQSISHCLSAVVAAHTGTVCTCWVAYVCIHWLGICTDTHMCIHCLPWLVEFACLAHINVREACFTDQVLILAAAAVPTGPSGHHWRTSHLPAFRHPADCNCYGPGGHQRVQINRQRSNALAAQQAAASVGACCFDQCSSSTANSNSKRKQP
jgi:hypothetical protein